MRLARAAWHWAVVASLAAQSALAQGSGVEARRLSNGLLVLVVPSAAQKNEVSAAVFAGFRDEPDTLRGLAHLAEHVAMRETRSGRSLATTADASGIAATAMTRGDVTIFSSSGSATSKTLETILEIERQRLSDLLVSPNTVLSEVQRIRVELNDRLGDQRDGNVLFGANRLSRSTSHADLARITEREVRAFIGRYYVPGNAVVLIETPLPVSDVMQLAGRILGALPAGRVVPRPVYRDSTRMVSTGRRGPIARGGGYGLAVTIPGLQHPARPALEHDLAVLRMRLAAEGSTTSLVTMSEQSPASVLAIRASSGAALDSLLTLLDVGPTVAPRLSQLPTPPDLLDCESAGDWRYCRIIADARAASPTGERLEALSIYLRGSSTPLPLWP